MHALCLLCREALYIAEGYSLNREGRIEEVNVEIENVAFSVSLHDTLEAKSALSEGAEAEDMGADRADDEDKDEDRMILRLRFDEISEFHKRRFLFRDVALEIFCVDGTNVLLACEEKGLRDWLHATLSGMRLPNSSMDDSGPVRASGHASVSDGSVVGSLLGAPQGWKRTRDRATKRWLSGQMTNLEYLMILNTLAGRSYSDLTQYHVMPFVLSRYDAQVLDFEDPSVYRDLSRPMGALSAERASYFQERYATLAAEEEDGGPPPFHYGTHYSSSAYVLNFLVRLEPYSRFALELQGGKFDSADRLFKSVALAWASASGEVFNAQDVREMVPELFVCPEVLLNMNRFRFGVTQSGQAVDDVELPRWANGSAYEFIRLHRQSAREPHRTGGHCRLDRPGLWFQAARSQRGCSHERVSVFELRGSSTLTALAIRLLGKRLWRRCTASGKPRSRSSRDHTRARQSHASPPILRARTLPALHFTRGMRRRL